MVIGIAYVPVIKDMPPNSDKRSQTGANCGMVRFVVEVGSAGKDPWKTEPNATKATAPETSSVESLKADTRKVRKKQGLIKST